MTHGREDLPQTVRDQLEGARQAVPPVDLVDTAMTEVRGTSQARVWPAWLRGSLLGLGAAAALLLVAVLLAGPFARHPLPTGSDSAGSSLAGISATAERAGFRLDLRTDKRTYTTDEPITASATLTYTGPDETERLWHGNPLVTFQLTQIGGRLEMAGLIDPICTSTVVTRNVPIELSYGKMVGWNGDDPNAAFYKQWVNDPTFSLPAGTWELTATGAFQVGQCGAPIPLEVSLRFTVTPASASATPVAHASATLVSPADTAQAKCEQMTEPRHYTPVGWVNGKLELLASQFASCDSAYGLVVLDPTTGRAGPLLPLTTQVASGGIATDGSSVAIVIQGGSSGGVLVVDTTGHQHLLAWPVGLGDAWFPQVVPMPAGGYLAVGAESLVTIASDGSAIRTQPIPAGYVVVAPTSDPQRFILATVEDANHEYGLSVRAPFTAYLWTIGSSSATKVAGSVGEVATATNAMAYLMLVDQANTSDPWSWAVLDGTGRAIPMEPQPAGYGTLSPDGSLFVMGRDGPTEADFRTLVIDVGSGRTVATLPGSGLPVSWNGDTAALVVSPSSGAGDELVIVGPSGETQTVPLPQP